MQPSDVASPRSDPRPARRPLFVPVVIAAVFLAVIGASAGAVLGARARDRAEAAAPQATSAGPDRTAQPCRPETQRQAVAAGASGTLRVELAVRTATSSAWICSDDDGRLYYHANRRNDQGAWIEGKTALFLTDVTRDGDTYRASTVDGSGQSTVFVVSSDSLLIIHKDGHEERQPAVGP